MLNDSAVYICTHKKVEYANINFEEKGNYKMICAGAALRDETFGYLRDDMCNGNTVENISRLNTKINEVTVLYWIWKNATESFVGLNHYRRFWLREGYSRHVSNILTVDELKSYMDEYDILVNHKVIFNGINAFEFLGHGIERDVFIKTWNKILIAMKLKQPLYVKSLYEMMNGYILYPNNMFFTRKEVFDSYCRWLFSFITDIAVKMNYDAYDNHTKRLVGYFCEWLFTVWLLKNQNRLRIKELPVIGMNDSDFKVGATDPRLDAHRL